MFHFEKFIVYQEAQRFYKLILEVLKKKEIHRIIKDQLRRASLSIVLNIAEGAGKYHKKDKKNYYLIARGSTHECVAILDILKLEECINEERYKKLYFILEAINKMLSGLINKMK